MHSFCLGKAAEKCVITKEEDYVSQTEDEELEEQDTENIEYVMTNFVNLSMPVNYF